MSGCIPLQLLLYALVLRGLLQGRAITLSQAGLIGLLTLGLLWLLGMTLAYVPPVMP